MSGADRYHLTDEYCDQHPYEPVRRPVHQGPVHLLLAAVDPTEETDVTMLAQELGRERWARDLSTAQNARLAEAIRRRRAAERSRDRARRLVRLAGLAARRSEGLALGALRVAR